MRLVVIRYVADACSYEENSSRKQQTKNSQNVKLDVRVLAAAVHGRKHRTRLEKMAAVIKKKSKRF